MMQVGSTSHLDIYQRTMQAWVLTKANTVEISFVYPFAYAHAQCFTLANVITDVADIDAMFLVAELGDMISGHHCNNNPANKSLQ